MELAIITADGQIHDVELDRPLRELVKLNHAEQDIGLAVLERADELLGTPAETQP